MGDGSIRLGMFEFVKRVAKAADISLIRSPAVLSILP